MAGMTGGLGTAVELLGGAGDLGQAGDAAQPELFADADDAPGPLPAPAPAASPRGGRPAGARNRSTEEWRRFILSQRRSPLLACADTWSRSPEDLARALHLTRTVAALAPGQQAIGRLYGTGERADVVVGYLVWDLERAFTMQQSAIVAALPYLHQKQPLAIEAKTETRGLVILGSLDVAGAEGGDDLALPLAIDAQQIEQNQAVTETQPEKSHGSQSHDAPNPLEFRDE